ncbi:MAG: dihydrofolate reductase [Prevotellaceae bacterium]|nr:dihydrofolate reductase [Candidatus Faecinaster equi]
MISIIVCIAENNAIGYEGGLLYHLRADLKRFKSLTSGHTVIMGRKTFESLPKGALPNRRNIVLTHQDINFPNTEVYGSLEEALSHCAENEDIFIIGGYSVYKEALPFASRLCLTKVYDTPLKADTFFPQFDEKEWQQTFSEEHEADEQNDKPFAFVDMERKL